MKIIVDTAYNRAEFVIEVLKNLRGVKKAEPVAPARGPKHPKALPKISEKEEVIRNLKRALALEEGLLSFPRTQ